MVTVGELMPLTVMQAEAEAQWRWGGLIVRGFARHSNVGRGPFEVGTRRFGTVKVRGAGNSWEDAFRDAADRTNRDPARKGATSSLKSQRETAPTSKRG
jgi:hypothetical protein